MKSNNVVALIDSDTLPKDWELKQLDEIAFINQTTSNLKEYSWINYTDISSVGTRTVDTPSRIEVAKAPSRARRVLKKGDTVISTVRPNRKSFFYFYGGWENAIASTGFAVISPKKLEDSNYLHAVLTSDLAVRIYENMCEGGAYPAFNASRLNEIAIPWPSKALRIELGHFVMNLQKKIEVNNSLSNTLIGISQTLFKSWFIDFDPVKAKMAGEQPIGMDSETAALFPNSIDESNVALTPNSLGWGTIGDIADVIDCLHAKKPELIEEGFPYLQLNTISDSGTLVYENAAKISSEDYKKWTSRVEVKNGDCLITNVGRVGAVSQVPEHFTAAIGRNITAIRPRDLTTHKAFLRAVLTSTYIKSEISRNTDSGTILEALNVRNIPHLRIPKPTLSTLKKFESICGPMYEEINSMHKQNVLLKEIRDALLPRLISGELQIPESMLAS